MSTAIKAGKKCRVLDHYHVTNDKNSPRKNCYFLTEHHAKVVNCNQNTKACLLIEFQLFGKQKYIKEVYPPPLLRGEDRLAGRKGG
jgi:hypothetical protein